MATPELLQQIWYSRGPPVQPPLNAGPVRIWCKWKGNQDLCVLSWCAPQKSKEHILKQAYKDNKVWLTIPELVQKVNSEGLL